MACIPAGHQADARHGIGVHLEGHLPAAVVDQGGFRLGVVAGDGTDVQRVDAQFRREPVGPGLPPGGLGEVVPEPFVRDDEAAAEIGAGALLGGPGR